MKKLKPVVICNGDISKAKKNTERPVKNTNLGITFGVEKLTKIVHVTWNNPSDFFLIHV